jgi:hypothetical protein
VEGKQRGPQNTKFIAALAVVVPLRFNLSASGSNTCGKRFTVRS